MPIYSIQGPDGKIYEIEGPAGATKAQVVAAIQAKMRAPEPEPVAIPKIEPAKREGFGAALGKGIENILSPSRTAISAVTGSPEEAALAGLKRSEESPYADQVSLDKVKQAYERGLLPAAGEVLRQIPLAITEQAPNIAATLGSARLGAMAGAGLGSVVPGLGTAVGTIGGGILGAVAPSLLQQFGGNIQRQAQEQLEAKKPVDISRTAALAAAVPQAGLDVAATFIPLGRNVAGAVLGPQVKQLLERGAKESAEKLARESLPTVLAKGAGISIATEAPTEAIQSMLERAQAGLPLLSEDAFKEYGEAAYQAALIAPIGSAARVGERSAARQEARPPELLPGETERQAAERIQAEILALKQAAQPPAPGPVLSTNNLFNLMAQPNGYGLVEQYKQRLKALPQQTPEIKQAIEEAEFAQRRSVIETAERRTPKAVETKEEDVAKPVAEPSGEGVPVAGEPDTGAAPEGVGAPVPGGVVPAVEDVGQPAAGEGQQPGAVVEAPAPVVPQIDVEGFLKSPDGETQEQRYTRLVGKQIAFTEAAREGLITPDQYASYKEELDKSRQWHESTQKERASTLSAESQEALLLADELEKAGKTGMASGIKLVANRNQVTTQNLEFYRDQLSKVQQAKVQPVTTNYGVDAFFAPNAKDKERLEFVRQNAPKEDVNLLDQANQSMLALAKKAQDLGYGLYDAGAPEAVGKLKSQYSVIAGGVSRLLRAQESLLKNYKKADQIRLNKDRIGVLEDIKASNSLVAETFAEPKKSLVEMRKRYEAGRAAPVETKPAPTEVEKTEVDKAVEAKIEELGRVLSRILSRVGLKDVALNLVEDMKSEGEYSQSVIRLALDAASPVRALRHESIHALKELGFFTPQQWAALEKQAKSKWVDQYLKNVNINQEPLGEGEKSRYDAYSDLYKSQWLSDAAIEEAIIEEAIADAFGDFDVNTAPPGLMQAILKRLRNLFDGIRTAFGGEITAEQVFRKVERGELKGAAPAQAEVKPSLRGKYRIEKTYVEDYKGREKAAWNVVDAADGYVYDTFDLKRDAADWIEKTTSKDQEAKPSLRKPGEPITRENVLGAMKRAQEAQPYMNCQLCVQMATGVTNLRGLPKVKEAKIGDVYTFGETKDMAAHYAIEVGNGDIAEVEQWGEKVRVIPLSEVVAEYGEPSAIRRPPETAYIAKVKPSLRDAAKIDLDRSLSDKRISPRLPTAVKAKEDAMGEARLQPDLDTFKRDDAAFRHNIGLMSAYPNFSHIKGTPTQRAEQMIEHMKGNLLWLFNSWNAKLRDRSKLWYVGGNRISHRWAEKYSIPAEQAAGIIAALSPQKDWFQNVSLAERTLDALVFNADTTWSPEMTRVFKERAWAKKFPLKKYQGTTLKDMYRPGDAKSLVDMAVWIRAWDEANNVQTARVITPEGTFTNEMAAGKTGKPVAMRAQSFAAMVKTLQVLQQADLQVISDLIGKNHKVRSFYNNIIAPYAGDDVTIDTHAVAAALLRPLGSSDLEVYHNFGSAKPAKKDKEGNILVPASAGTKNSAVTGLYGTYAMYAEAYRRAAQEAGVLPREMQSITWEAIRGLFRPEQKQAKLKNQTNVLWNKVGKGEIDGQTARDEISKLVSGIEDPAWAKSPVGANESRTDSSYADELPGVGVPGREPAGVPSGVGERVAGAIPKASLREADATWSDKRIDKLINDYGYTDGRTFGIAARVNPEDFLRATTPSKEFADEIKAEAGKLDREEIARESQTPFLEWDIEKGVITGHEGRHRMAAMSAEGVQSAPVVLYVKDRFGSKRQDQYERRESVEIKGQKFESGRGSSLTATNLIPLEYRQTKALKEEFGGEGLVKFSLRSATPADIRNRVLQTTVAREEKGFAQRITEAIAPESFSNFRAAALNRYNQLGVYDKKLAEKMGGAALLANNSAESAALLSDLGAGLTASALGVHDRMGGVPVYKNGITIISNKNNTIKGPTAIFAPLAKFNDPFAYQAYQFWAGVKRGLRLLYTIDPKTGNAVERLFTEEDGPKAERLRQQYLKQGVDFNAIQEEWIKFNNGLVDYMVDTGVLSKERADIYKQYSDYLPFYRQMEGEETVGPKIFQAISGVKPPKKLKGSAASLDDFLETIVRNTQSAIQAGVKNVAAQRAADVAMKIQMARRLPYQSSAPNTFQVLEDGKVVTYMSTDMLFINAIKSLGLPDLPFIGMLSGPANLLRNLVTKDPGFMLANLMRDSMSAWVTSGVKMTPMVDTISNFGSALAGKDPAFQALMNAGILGGYEFSQNVEQSGREFAKALRKQAKVKAPGYKGILEMGAKPFTSLWEALEKGTTASDAATRMEVYKKTLAETGNEAEALYRALEVMNFNRKGSSAVIRILTAAVPFLNARMQGLDVLYRAATGKIVGEKAAEIQKQFFVRGATIAALSAAYWLLTHDDDEYKKQEEETRDNYWLLPSLGVKIPIPFEIGVLFKVIPERILAYTMGSDTGEDFLKSMFRQLTSTLAFNPIPQTALPVVEAMTNFSFFTMRPIVGQGLEGVQPAYQVGPGTSRLAEKIGAATKGLATELQISPMKLDNLINGYTGTMGMYLVNLMDAVYDMNTDSPKPSMRFERMPVIRRFAVDPEARGSVTAYYELKNSVDAIVRTSNMLERTMNYEELPGYLQDNMRMLASKDYLLDLEKTMKEFREMKVMIRSSQMDADAKKDAILSIDQMENQLTANIQYLKSLAKGG